MLAYCSTLIISSTQKHLFIAMDELRTRVPLHWRIQRHQKLSKIETLRLAR